MTTDKVTNKRMAMTLGRILTTAFAYYIRDCKVEHKLTVTHHNELSELQTNLYGLINQNKVDASIHNIPGFLTPYLDQSIQEVGDALASYAQPSFTEVKNKLKVLI